jgi:hypothetical protein
MIDNFLNDLKVKGFISVSKDTENFDTIRKLEAEGLIEKKSQYTYILTNDGHNAADMGYDKFHLSLDLNPKNVTTPPHKAQKIITQILIGLFVTVLGGLMIWYLIKTLTN